MIARIFSNGLSGVFTALFLVTMGSNVVGETRDVVPDSATVQAIVNGQAPFEDAQPWMVALTYKSASDTSLESLQSCGGTLIDPLWVITAAHCVGSISASERQVVIGREDLEESEGVLTDLAEIIIHPDWNGSGPEYDVALLRLAEPSSATTLPIAEPDMIPGLYDKSLTVLGWGNLFDDQHIECEVVMATGFTNKAGYVCDTITFERTNTPPSLLKAEIVLKDGLSCNQRSNAFFQSVNLALPQPGSPSYVDPQSTSLCGWHRDDLSTPCYGDSGGPLVGSVGGKDYLVGIVSRGYLSACRREFQIGFYANASLFREFVESAKKRDLSLGFEGFCPDPVRPAVSYTASTAGKSRVLISWDPQLNAEAYTLYFSPVPRVEGFVGKKSLPGSLAEFSLELKSGQHYLVAMQAQTARCDGPMSSAVEVLVP